tara:strand:- start:423 stop:1661 length:1239 start_codon:yes stop_codon:yes gene_type:complete
MSVNPHYIAYGINDCDRETLAIFLSLFENTELAGMAYASLKDHIGKTKSSISNVVSKKSVPDKEKSISAVSKRIESGKTNIINSKDETEVLRLRLWLHIWHALHLEPKVPLSAQEVAECTKDISKVFAHEVSKIWWQEHATQHSVFSKIYWSEFGQYKFNPFKKNEIKVLDFSQAFSKMFSRIIEGLDTDEHEQVRKDFGNRALEYIGDLDETKRNKLMEAAHVEELSNENALKVLLLQSGVIGTGIISELAGFAAYLMAAETTTIIPFIAGSTLVSTVAVLSNPLFIIAAAIAIEAGLGTKATNKMSSLMALNAISILTLKGVVAEKQNVRNIVTMFNKLSDLIPQEYVSHYKNHKNSGALKNKVTDRLEAIGTTVWESSKVSFQLPKYPHMDPYLRQWELSSKEKLSDSQ